MEAEYLEINHITPEYYLLKLEFTGPVKTTVNGVALDMGSGWDPGARFVDLPEGWKRLDTNEEGILRLEGAEATLPFKLKIVSASKIPELVPMVKLNISAGKYEERKNVPAILTKLPFPEWEEESRITDLRVIVRKANIRSKPGLKSRIVTSAPEGEMFRSDKKIMDWFRVLLPSDASGKKKYGYIHRRVVEEEKKAAEAPVEIPKEAVKPKKKEPVPIVIEPRKIKTEPLIKRLLKESSVKISAGPGFFMNGMGDLEKLRTETEAFVNAMRQARFVPETINVQNYDASETDSGYQTSFNWDPLRFNTHFQVGINFDLNPKFSAGLSIGNFRAGNDNIEYSFSRECEGGNQGWSWNETERNTFTESYNLSAFPVYANFNYCSNPKYSNGKFSPEVSIGIGPIFANMKRNFTENMEFSKVTSSTHYSNSSDLNQLSRRIAGAYNATGLGIQLSGGIDYQLSPTLTVGLDGFFNFASFSNWKGSEEGAWNSKTQRSNNGEVFQDESDSGSWNFNDLPLYYYYGSYYGIDRPFMFVGKEPPLNGVAPSINWNSWGIQLTFKISLGGKPEPADAPEVAKTPDPSGDPGTNPTDTPPPTIYGEDLEKKDKIWNAYVFVGSLSGWASIWTKSINNAAMEAQEDFINAGYNVILKYKAKSWDFKKVMKDPQAKAFWFAGHGDVDDDGNPVPIIKDVRDVGIAPVMNKDTEEYSEVVFTKEGLNQVTIHACKQDLPEWRNAFPRATYISWSIKIVGLMVYYWQYQHTYPKIDQATGEEIGK